MRVVIIGLTGLLTTALALPGSHHHGHKDFKSGTAATGGPYSTGTGGAPYGLGNATANASDIGRYHSLHHKPYSGKADVTDSSTALAQAALATGISPNDVVVQMNAADNAGTCGPLTVTVTVNGPAVTVTVTPGVGGFSSSAASQPSYGRKNPVQGPYQPSSNLQSLQVPIATTSLFQTSAIQASQAPLKPSTASAISQPSQAPSEPSAASSVAEPPQAPTSAQANPSTPSQAPVTPANPGSKTKRGIIASGTDMDALAKAFTNSAKVSWLGNWFSSPPPSLPASLSFVPQNYGKQSDTRGEWTKNAGTAVEGRDQYMLSFGEPNTPNAQLQMDAQQTVDLWMSKMQPYTNKVSVGAPGILQNHQDFTFLKEFLNLCETAGCNIGFLAVHWFYVADVDNIQGFQDVISNVTSVAKGKPVWVDNFQATGTADAQKKFFAEMVPWLDSQPQIARYAYVPLDKGTGNGFLNADGSLSDLGQYYSNL